MHICYDVDLAPSYIEKIIKDEKLIPYWMSLNPTVYFKDGEPYGLIGVFEECGIKYLATSTSDIELPFTRGMIRDILKMMKTDTVCLLSAAPSKHEMLRDKLSRYNFAFSVHNDVLYALGGKYA